MGFFKTEVVATVSAAGRKKIPDEKKTVEVTSWKSRPNGMEYGSGHPAVKNVKFLMVLLKIVVSKPTIQCSRTVSL